MCSVPKGARKKKLAFLAGNSAKALTPLPASPARKRNKAILCKFYFLHMDIYTFLKPANSDMENSFLKKFKNVLLKKFIYSGNWKLEKTLFDGHKNNTAIGVDYLTWKKKKKN